MSRIHEALKKAEQDRANTQGADEPALAAPEIPLPGRIPAVPAVVMETRPLATTVLPALPLGAIRFEELRARCMQIEWQPDTRVNVFLNSESNPRGTEQFRTMRSRLYQIRSAQPLSTVLVTSSVPAEGKTFVTANLAQAIIRQPDRRVLIIDGDMRCPRLHEMVGAPQTPGLTNYLRGETDEASIIQDGGVGNLFMIAGGTKVPNPSELLSSGRLKTLLERVGPAFDWVLVDAPPCLPVADATVIAEICDGVLFVVRAGSTPAAVAQRALQELRGRTVLGVVLNAVEDSHAYASTYYSSYGYGYGYGSDNSEVSRG